MKIRNVFLIVLVVILLAAVIFYFSVNVKPAKKMIWGVNFSQAQAQFLKLDWKQLYLAMMEDLKVDNIKLITNWDFVEPKKEVYYFNDTDWQVDQAESHGASLIYVVGMKTGRWPECHVPDWAENLSKKEQQTAILKYIEVVVNRYKGNSSIVAWQAENEPLFNFGICPWYDSDFLAQEVQLIKSLDPIHPVIVSDSGEQSLWLKAASIGDAVGVTTYRKVWFHITDTRGFFVSMPFPPKIYGIKAWIVDRFFSKEVIGVELQAEPWVNDVYADVSLQEQLKSMNIDVFKANVDYAKKTGLNTFYFWGTEWWYWLKTTQNRPEIWNAAKDLFVQ